MWDEQKRCRFQQLRQDVFGTPFITLTQGADCILKNGILRALFGHKLIVV